MEVLFEIIFSIIFEGSIEIMQDKKVPKWLRIICTILVSALFLFVIGILGLISIISWQENVFLSIIFLVIGLVLIVFTIKKIKAFKLKNNI